MNKVNIYFDKEEDDIIKKYSDKFNLSKEETIKKIIRDFNEEKIDGYSK